MIVRRGSTSDAASGLGQMSLGGVARLQWSGMVGLGRVVLGLAGIGWASQTAGFTQSLLLELSAAVLLFVPLFLLEELLRKRVERLEGVLRGSSESYAFVRNLLPSGPQRTEVLDQIVEGVREKASHSEFAEAEVERMLTMGEGFRVIALGAMRGNHKYLRDPAVLRSITNSETAMEQYHAMLVAHDRWDELQPKTRQEILAHLERDENDDGGYIASSRRRAGLARSIREKARLVSDVDHAPEPKRVS
jgi:hypothetical protein